MSRSSRRQRAKTGAPAGARTHATAAQTSGPLQPARRTTWLVALAITIATVVVYAPVVSHDFVQLDDPAYVTENVQVRRGLTAEGFGWAFSSGHAANWHPLTWISHMLDVTFFGLNPGAHHVVNVALHIASTLLLFFWLHRTTGAIGASAFVASLFALHPLHVESVAWIAERKDVLSTFFWMLTLWAYVRMVEQRTPARYAMLVVTYGLGLMAKPMLVTLPFVLLLLDWWPLRRFERDVPSWGLVREKLPLFALSAASSIVTFLVQRAGGAVTGLDALPVRLRLENAVMSYAGYLGKMVWPVDLAIVYGRPADVSPGLVLSVVVALLAVSMLAVRLRNRSPYIAVGWFWYLGTLVPVIGLVQVGVQAMADRYTYIPLLGIFVAIAWIVQDVLQRRPALARTTTAAALVVVASCAVLARRQVAIWKDNGTLFAHATSITLGVDSAAAHVQVGAALLEQGRIDEAIQSFLEARRLAPHNADAPYHLGLAYARQSRYEDASAALSEAIRMNPDHARAYAALGLAVAQQGRVHEAIAHYRQALRIDSSDADVHNNLGSALANQGRLDDALPEFREAVRLRPDFHDARINLAVALAALGHRAEATAELDEVLRRDPSNARARGMIRR